MSSSSDNGRCTPLSLDREHRKTVRKKYGETSNDKPLTSPTTTGNVSDDEYRPAIIGFDYKSLEILQHGVNDGDDANRLVLLDNHSDDTDEVISIDDVTVSSSASAVAAVVTTSGERRENNGKSVARTMVSQSREQW